ncbi:hypothetical protein [Bradyrhizobium sp. CB82]|uniref:hypothetical protein n=1 Tax=Bradyrhizobium sp. CB82 TaxID=3039159 RepID=UPI0032C21961
MNGTVCSERPPCERKALAGELGEIVLRAARAKSHTLLSDDGKIAFPVLGQQKAGAGLVARQGESNSGQPPNECRDRGDLHVPSQQVDAHEAAERAMMSDEGVGDRADHAGSIGTERFIDCIAEIEHVRCTIRRRHVRHAVIGDDTDHRSRSMNSPMRLSTSAMKSTASTSSGACLCRT